MATVALVFAPLAPLVSVAAAIVFWISSWVYKYQLMFVFVTQVETGGVGIVVCIRRLTIDPALFAAPLEHRRQQVAGVSGPDADANGSQ
jgi:hypothetical protein